MLSNFPLFCACIPSDQNINNPVILKQKKDMTKEEYQINELSIIVVELSIIIGKPPDNTGVDPIETGSLQEVLISLPVIALCLVPTIKMEGANMVAECRSQMGL